MVLTFEQKRFFQENGFLPYRRVLSNEEVEALRQRCEEIARGKEKQVPARFIQLEAAFRDHKDGDTDPFDRVRKMTHLCYFDALFEAAARKAEIVDVIEDLLGPTIKLYCDQLMLVSCWVAMDDATVDNGCMTVSPGSHKWGPIERTRCDPFLANSSLPKPVPIELEAGSCMFHHGLNFHRTGANPTPNRRRGLALYYLCSETMYLGAGSEEQRLMTECEKPPGAFRFMLIRGKEFPGRV